MFKMLTLARLKRKTKVLGPGVRAVVWTSGCSRNCPDCVAAEMNRERPRFVWSAARLYDWVAQIDGIDGIVVSGGEPFEQDLDALAEFLELVKSDPRNLAATLYTGMRFDELRRDANALRVLSRVDLLIDGPYRRELNDGRIWRGSSNQNLIALNERFAEIAENAKERFGREIELEISQESDGSNDETTGAVGLTKVTLTGIPESGFLEKLRRKLQKNGFELN